MLLSLEYRPLGAVPEAHAGQQRQVAGLLGDDLAMADEEVDDDQVAIVLELVCVCNQRRYLRDWQAPERLDLTVLRPSARRLQWTHRYTLWLSLTPLVWWSPG